MAWLADDRCASFRGSLRKWRSSLAGLLGAVASACWFTAFSLTPAANFRAPGLIEMPMAAVLSWRLAGRCLPRHELAGLLTVMAGVGLLFASAGP